MKPIVASYCTTFLKPEMLHIYRQVTGLQRFETVVLTRERKNADRFPFENIEIIPRARKNFIKRFYLKYVRRKPPVYYRGELQVLLKIFKRRPADLMHIYFGHTAVHLLPFIEEWDRPCVVSFHGADVMLRPDQAGYDEEFRRMLGIVPLVLARSHSLCERLVSLGCPPEKIRLNRTGVPLEQFPFKQRPMPSDGEWQFVQACRLIPKKGLRTAITAFANFRKAWPKAKFIIAGEGPMREELETLAGELHIGAAVQFRGFLGQDDLRDLYSRSHVFLHPSELMADQNQEGVPNSMLEAMATGLPILATRHGGIPEAVTHEKTGLLVPERDVESLSQAMRQITESSDILYIMGQAASQSVREEFEQAKQIAKLESYYDEALATRPPRPAQ